MGGILQHWKVLGATLFSVVLVVGAYLLARGVTSPPAAQASVETALLQAIATRDSDTDDLPDWEEALYGTDPKVQDTFHLGMTDGEAVAEGLVVPKAIADVSIPATKPGVVRTDPSIPTPAEGTMTATFAKNFFTLYLKAVQASPDGNLSQADMQNVATETLAQLAASVSRSPNFKSAQNITVVGSGSEAMKSFATSAEAVFRTNKANAAKSELLYLKDAMEHKDPNAIVHIASIAKTYRSTAAGLAVLPVPTELASGDLALINAMARLGEIAEDFTRVESDPLATMLALQQYASAVQDLGNALIEINRVYGTAGVTLSPGEPGAEFVNLIVDIAASQKSAASNP